MGLLTSPSPTALLWAGLLQALPTPTPPRHPYACPSSIQPPGPKRGPCGRSKHPRPLQRTWLSQEDPHRPPKCAPLSSPESRGRLAGGLVLGNSWARTEGRTAESEASSGESAAQGTLEHHALVPHRPSRTFQPRPLLLQMRVFSRRPRAEGRGWGRGGK